MSTIHLSHILDSNSDLTISGNKLYEFLKSAIDKNENTIIDMENATSLPSIFLNCSFGRIIDEFGADAVRQFVSFVKITKSQAERIRDYILNYKA